MLADFARPHPKQLVCPTVQRRQTFEKGDGVWSHFLGTKIRTTSGNAKREICETLGKSHTRGESHRKRLPTFSVEEPKLLSGTLWGNSLRISGVHPTVTWTCNSDFGPWDIVGHLQESKGLSLENSENKSEKGLPEPLGPGSTCPKKSRRVENDYFSSFFRVFGSFSTRF